MASSYRLYLKFGVNNYCFANIEFDCSTLNRLGQFGYDSKLETCSILQDVYGRSSKTPLFIMAFVIPCIIIIVCYARIFWVVHE